MSWDNDNNPWGKKPPENKFSLDDLLNFIKKNLFGDKGPSFLKGKPKAFLSLLLIVPILIWFVSGFYKLLPYEEALVMRFGKWVRTDQPGLNYHLPYPIEIIKKVPTGTIHRMDIGIPSRFQGYPNSDEHIMLTGDENILHIGLSFSWQIKDLQQYVLISQNPIATLKIAAQSVLREIIGNTQTAPIISRSGWGKINAEVMERLQYLTDKYEIGIRIVNVEMHTALPPQPVSDAFTEVQRARTYQEHVVNQAEAYSNDKIPRARGESGKIVQKAEGQAVVIINEAIARSERFKSIQSEYKKDPRMNEKRLRYEKLTKILSRNHSKQIFDKELMKAGIVPYLPLSKRPHKLEAKGK